MWKIIIAAVLIGSHWTVYDLGLRASAARRSDLLACWNDRGRLKEEARSNWISLDMCEKATIRNMREQNEWMAQQTQIMQRMRGQLRGAIDAKCDHLMIDTAQEYTSQQLRQATTDYARCIGVDVIDWCDLPERDRKLLDPTGTGRECPDAL
jgi:hypothetical protein